MTVHQAFLERASTRLLIKATELRAYQRDGVIRLRNVLTPDEVASLRRAVDDQFANRRRSKTAYDFQDLARQYWIKGERFTSASATRFDLDRLTDVVASDALARPMFDETEDGAPPRGDAAFFYEAAGWRTYPDIRKVAFDTQLPEISAILMESEYVNFWEDTTFVKTPGATLRTPRTTRRESR